MLNINKLNLKWRIKRLVALLITIFERKRFLSVGDHIIKDAPLLDKKIFSDVEKIIQPGAVKYFILPKETLSYIVDSFQSDKYLSLFNRMGVTQPVVSYITFYQTQHLQDPTQSVYANHWHTDDTLRPNAVKFFQLPDDLDESIGPFEILDRAQTLANWKMGFVRGYSQPLNDVSVFKFMSKNVGLIANTNKCMHRAGVPAKGKARKMLMVQINDGAGNCSLEKLYNRQFDSEPTLLKNFFSSK